MRSTIIGVVLGAIFIAAIFALSITQHHVAPPLYVQAAGDVDKNFVGEKRIGRWVLICLKPAPRAAGTQAAIPFSINPDPKTSAAATAAQAESPMARCLVTLRYAQQRNPKAVLMVVNFRYTRDFQRLAMVLRFPSALAQKGDTINVIVGNRQLPVTVDACQANGPCVALGYLDSQVQSVILSKPQGLIVFPAKKDAKPLKLPIPFVVLKEAFAAMKRAGS